MIYVGIDPGLKGAVAVLDERGAVIEAFPMPLTKDRAVDALRLYTWAGDLAEAEVWLERAVAFGMGRTSAFNYGAGWSAVRVAFELAGHNVKLVMPNVWHRSLFGNQAVGVPAKLKALELASSTWGTPILLRNTRSKRAHDGIVDALLIAEYGRRLSRCSGT